MSSLTVTITNAGRAALVNAQANGTAPLTISQVGVSASVIAPAPGLTALAGEIKRLGTISGSVTDPATIHVTIKDETLDGYTIRAFGLYLSNGTLFAIYGQADPILVKTAQTVVLLATDIKLTDIAATALTFGDTNFVNPDATTEAKGVVELATDAETAAKVDAYRAITPKTLWFAFSAWVAAAFSDVWRASNDGDGSGLDADLLDGQQGAYYSNIPARLGYTPANKAGDTFTGNVGSPTFVVGNSNSRPVIYESYEGILTVRCGVVGSYRFFNVAPSGLTFDGSVVWNSANDGSGSGLDADLLDGLQASQFVRADGAVTQPNSNAVVLAGTAPNIQNTFTGALQLREVGLVGNTQSNNAYAPSMTWHWSGITAASISLYFDGSLRARPNSSDPSQYSDFYAASFLSYGQLVWSARNDGAGSGLDADLLDGQDGSFFTNIPARLGYAPVNRAGDTMAGSLTWSNGGGSIVAVPGDSSNTGYLEFKLPAGQRVGYLGYGGSGFIYFNTESGYAYNFNVRPRFVGNLPWDSANDGAGSGLDADLLDGQDGSFFTNIPARLGYIPVNRAGDTMTGPLAAPSVNIVGAPGANGLAAGNGDDATFSTYNMAMNVWFGLGIKTFDGSVNGVYNARAGFWDVKGGYRVNGQTVWHAANDGAGSGLDADLLDGLQASDFAQLAAFASSLGTAGYQRFPSGLILKWGTVANVPQNGGQRDFNWADGNPFPNQCLIAMGFQTQDITNSLERSNANVTNWSRFGAKACNNATYAAIVGYIALGI